MTIEEKPLHIVSLHSENVKRIRVARVRPNGALVIVAGENAQGKSSLLDSVEMALAGARAIPLEPIRRGSRKASIVVDLGDIVVERTFTAKGTQLVVKGKDGIEKASPQKLLDSLTAKVSFDPLAFARMEAKDQDALLKRLVGLDFSDIETERALVYAKRTDANKELARLDHLIDEAAPHHAGAPAQPVNVAALMAKLKEHDDAAAARARLVAPIERMRAQVAAKEESIVEFTRQLRAAEQAADALRRAIEEHADALPPEPHDPGSISAELASAQETNAKVSENAARAKLEKEASAKAEEIEGYTARIERLDQDKAEQLAGAKYPIDGLGFDDAGPTFRGMPLSQASQAERLRVSVAIGAALNPKLRVMLVREGAFLDDNSLKLLAELAAETESQIWVEMVRTSDPSAVIISDGTVLDAPAEEHANGQAVEG